MPVSKYIVIVALFYVIYTFGAIKDKRRCKEFPPYFWAIQVMALLAMLIGILDDLL